MTFLYPFSGLEQVCGGSLPAIDKQTVLSATTRSSNLSINRLRDCNKALNSWACYRSWKCSTMKCVHVRQWFKRNGFTLQFPLEWHFHQHGHRHHRLSPSPPLLLLFQLFDLYELMLVFNTTDYSHVTLLYFLPCYPLYSKFAVICDIVCLLYILAFSTQFLLVLRLGTRKTFLPSAPYICMSCLFMWSFLPLYLLDITTVCVSHLQRLSSRIL